MRHVEPSAAPSLKDLRDRYFDMLTADVGAARAKKTVERILWAIKSTDYPCDWFKQNPALKAVCKDYGILKSGDLRAQIKKNYGDGFLPYDKIGDEPSPISFTNEKKSSRIE